MRRSHYSSQAAVGPRHADYPLRNPWVEKHPDSSSSSASRSARPTSRAPQLAPQYPPPVVEWLRPGPPVHRGPQLNRPELSLPGSSPPESAVGSSPAGCGGNCAACDSFCYHCLQVVYIAGILTGVSLTIAGSVLRGSPRRGDLLVLVYIGVLLAAVCTLLLSVHYCVRRSVKERKQALRRPLPQPSPSVAIPLQEFVPLRQGQEFPTELRHPQDFLELRQEFPTELRQPRVHGISRSRSGHSSHSRRYYSHDVEERPVDEWERQPYQPLIHRPR